VLNAISSLFPFAVFISARRRMMVQFHPELKSRPFAPHPLFVGFIGAALEHGVSEQHQVTVSTAP
jgi:hypothetical protein